MGEIEYINGQVSSSPDQEPHLGYHEVLDFVSDTVIRWGIHVCKRGK